MLKNIVKSAITSNVKTHFGDYVQIIEAKQCLIT